MLDLASTQHQNTEFRISELEDQNSSSVDKKMSDFLNAFEAFLSGSSCPAETAEASEGAEEDCAMSSVEESPLMAADADCSPTVSAGGGALTPGDKMTPERPAVKTPPDKELPPTKLSLSTPPSVSAVLLPSSAPEVPSVGLSCDKTATVSDGITGDGADQCSSTVTSPLVPKPSVPHIKPIVPPIKLRKVDFKVPVVFLLLPPVPALLPVFLKTLQSIVT